MPSPRKSFKISISMSQICVNFIEKLKENFVNRVNFLRALMSLCVTIRYLVVRQSSLDKSKEA